LGAGFLYGNAKQKAGKNEQAVGKIFHRGEIFDDQLKNESHDVAMKIGTNFHTHLQRLL
jgi:uncharacterized protein YjbJ (UPF0337 family)